MLPLAVSFFATRINSDIPNYCYQSYLEGDLALNDGYLVAAVLNRNWPNKFWTISIFVDTTRGTNWLPAEGSFSGARAGSPCLQVCISLRSGVRCLR